MLPLPSRGVILEMLFPGIRLFEGLSLPEPPVRDADEEAQAYRWEYLQIDPLFDLRLWCTPAAEPPRKIVGEKPAAQILWEATISKYIDASSQHIALKELLESNQIEPFFAPAWNKVVATGLPTQAFAAAGNEGPDVSRVFAEAVVAQMMHDAAQSQPPVPISPRTGYKIIAILLLDWKQAALLRPSQSRCDLRHTLVSTVRQIVYSKARIFSWYH